MFNLINNYYIIFSVTIILISIITLFICFYIGKRKNKIIDINKKEVEEEEEEKEELLNLKTIEEYEKLCLLKKEFFDSKKRSLDIILNLLRVKKEELKNHKKLSNHTENSNLEDVSFNSFLK